MDERVFNLLNQADYDWERIALELTDYAVVKVKRLRWRTGSYESLPQGKTPEDLAYEAIEKVFSGDRRWNPDKNPDLLRYLKSVVNSLVSHLVESDDHKRLQYFPDTEDGVDLEEVLPLTATSLSHSQKNPEEELLEKEREEQVLSEIFDAVDGDVELEELVGAIMEGYTKPAEIARAWNRDVKDVYRLVRKLRRRIMRQEGSQTIDNSETSGRQRRRS